MLLGFSRDILEGWARGCCVHGILVQGLITAYVILMVRANLFLIFRPYQKVIDKSLGFKGRKFVKTNLNSKQDSQQFKYKKNCSYRFNVLVDESAQ